MTQRPLLEKTVAQLQDTVEALKTALRDVVFEAGREKSAILGAPRNNYKWPDVFVAMPFSSKLEPVYEDHIKKAIARLDLEVGRADDFFRRGSIMSDIWSAIHAARVVVADLTGRNPNVLYEIGLAHAIGKDTILISQSMDDVPSDLRHLRVIVYEFSPRGMKAFEKQLVMTITNSVLP
jgi:hypothetical protein